MDSARSILALDSGLPTGKREKRWLFMIQAFVDDSRWHGDNPVFVLGGYLARAEDWAKFSDDWRRALETPPAIRVFKMNDALRGNKEFHGMSEERRTSKIAMMRSVIEQHVNAEFSVAFRVDHYQAAYAHWGKEHQNPYYFAMATLTGFVARHIDRLGFPREPVDFIFDMQVMEMDKVMAAWQWARESQRQVRPNPSDMLEILKNPPTFRSDEDLMPLQAADMQAVWVRRNIDLNGSQAVIPPMPGFKKQLRGVVYHYSEQQMRDAAAQSDRFVRNAYAEGRL